VKASAVQVAQLAVAVIALFTGWVLADVAYQAFGRGPIPAKHLNSTNTGAVDILDDLRNAGDAINTSVLDAKGKRIDNLYSSLLYLGNSGTSPVVTSDYDGKVKLTTKEPWSFITIRNNSDVGAPQFNWRKVSNTEFEADPILINPGDFIGSTVYLTSSSPKPDGSAIPLIWDVRIANLHEIDYGNSEASTKSEIPQLLNVSVGYVGNYLIVFLLLFIAYLSTYVYYLMTQGYLRSKLMDVVYVVLSALFSLVAADATVTYISQPFATINHTANAPFLICNFLLLCWIAYKMHQKVGGARNPEVPAT
jgi:hypothetical protein